MARKPARLERSGALTPRDRMWAAIRDLSRVSDHAGVSAVAPFSAVDVQFLANLRAPEPQHVDSVLSYLTGLARATPPYLSLWNGERPAGRKRTELALYVLARDVGVDAPRVTGDGKPVTQGIGTERMWTAMKALREFDAVELAVAASTPEHQVSEETAKSYVASLARAGYVACTKPAVHGHVKARYRFNRAMNTGPRPPLITKKKEVLDGNTGRVVWPKADA